MRLEDVLMRSLRLWSSYQVKYVKPSWIRLQNVIFMQEDQIGSYYKIDLDEYLELYDNILRI